MKAITKLISIITGTGIAASSFFAACTDYYGPAPGEWEKEAERCCQDAANYEHCVKVFRDTGECETDNAQP
ncbi:MAG: hypothetical protein J6A01_01335 [Proteobacteria bacterium]|nr:hypothetical protein [Pseudomonadota bacterium]